MALRHHNHLHRTPRHPPNRRIIAALDITVTIIVSSWLPTLYHKRLAIHSSRALLKIVASESSQSLLNKDVFLAVTTDGR